MKRILATGLATVTATVAALSTFATPAKALDEGEAVVLGIGSALLGCAIAGCFNNNRNNNYYYHSNYPAYYDYNYRQDYYRPAPRVYYKPAPRVYYKPAPRVYYGNQRPSYRYDSRYDNRYYNSGYNRGNVGGQINQIYRDALGRNVDRNGLSTYSRQYQNGRSLESIRRDIYNSEEARRIRRW